MFDKNQKINIFYIENGIGFGGAVTSLCALIKELNKDRYFPIVLSSHNDETTKKLIKDAGAIFFYVRKYRRQESLNSFLKKVANLGAIPKSLLSLSLFLIETFRRIPFILKCAGLIKDNNVNIVHLNNSIDSNLEGLVVAKLMQIPCIAYLRGPEYNSFEARFFAKYISYFIAVSNFVKGDLVKIGVPLDKVKVIYDGIKVDEYKEKAVNFSNSEVLKYYFGKYNIGLFGCLLKWKGHRVFIEAINALINGYKIKDCKFFIVGDVPDQKSKLKEELVNLVKEFKLSEYIIFTGQQDNVLSFMARMDIIVHTSIEPEPFGRVVIEAMALGKPVIATKMGGPLEIIEDRVNGFLIPADNPVILAETIFALLNNNDKRKQIAMAAENTIKEKFNINNFIKEIEDIYDKVVI